MRKKHDHSALLKYMHMLEGGYSINYIHTHYGINAEQLTKLWILYQRDGRKVLCRQEYTRNDATFRYKVVLDIENNGISLVQASIKYGVSTSRLVVWLRTYRTGGFEALSTTKKRGRPSGMGRPKKKLASMFLTASAAYFGGLSQRQMQTSKKYEACFNIFYREYSLSWRFTSKTGANEQEI